MNLRQHSAKVAEQMQTDDDTPPDRRAERSDREGAHIPPWYLLAGLSKLDRLAVCDMLAIFECLSVANVGIDKVRDWISRRKRANADQSAFEKRLHKESWGLNRSSGTTDALRFQLWCEIR